MMRILAFCSSERQIATSCLLATGKSARIASRSMLTLIMSSASWALFLTFFQLTVFLPSSRSAESAMFSATVRFGKMAKS